MKKILFWLLTYIAIFQTGAAMAYGINMIKMSRESGIKIISKSENSSGSGFFIGDQTVLTCFHVVSAIAIQGQTISWTIHPDLVVILPSGETIPATVVSIPTQFDRSPLDNDFALLHLNTKPTKDFSKVSLAAVNETQDVGDDVIFSGYPLATPGMVTHRGMISGFDDSGSLMFIQASINKGNSGGAVLNSQGHVIGIVSLREGGISQGLSELNSYIDQTENQGSVRIMGVDPLQTSKAIIQTLDMYISTGIGYARNIKFVRDYITKNPSLLK